MDTNIPWKPQRERPTNGYFIKHFVRVFNPHSMDVVEYIPWPLLKFYEEISY